MRYFNILIFAVFWGSAIYNLTNTTLSIYFKVIWTVLGIFLLSLQYYKWLNKKAYYIFYLIFAVVTICCSFLTEIDFSLWAFYVIGGFILYIIYENDMDKILVFLKERRK